MQKVPLKMDRLCLGLLENTGRQRYYKDTRNKSEMILGC
jgi:hypothetical protein